MALRRTHVGNARRKGGGSCFVPDTLRNREVNPGCENALPVLLGQIFAYFTIFRSRQSYKHVVGDAQDESDLAEGVLFKAHNLQISPSCACLSTTHVQLRQTSPVTSCKFALVKENP